MNPRTESQVQVESEDSEVQFGLFMGSQGVMGAAVGLVSKPAVNILFKDVSNNRISQELELGERGDRGFSTNSQSIPPVSLAHESLTTRKSCAQPPRIH